MQSHAGLGNAVLIKKQDMRGSKLLRHGDSLILSRGEPFVSSQFSCDGQRVSMTDALLIDIWGTVVDHDDTVDAIHQRPKDCVEARVVRVVRDNYCDDGAFLRVPHVEVRLAIDPRLRVHTCAENLARCG